MLGRFKSQSDKGTLLVETQRARGGLFASEPVQLLATVIAVLYFGRAILIPVALALTLNFLLAPAVIYLHRFRIRRIPAVIIVVIVAGSIMGGVGWVVARQLLHIAYELPDYQVNLHEKMAALHAPSTGSFGRALRGVSEVGQEFTASSQPALPANAPAKNSATAATGKGRTAVGETALTAPAPAAPIPVTVVAQPKGVSDLLNAMAPIVQPLGETVFVLVLTVYMLINQEDLHNRLLLLAGMGHLNLVTKALDDAGKRISSYLTMNLMVNAGYALCFGLGLSIIGIPYATLWAVIAGVLRFVPYIGTSIGAVLPF